MKLFVAELIRFWTRRITWVVFGVSCILMTLIVGIAFTRTSAEAPAEDASPVVLDQQCLEDFESGEFQFPEGPDGSDLGQPTPEEFCTRWVGDPDKRFWAVEMLGQKSVFSGDGFSFDVGVQSVDTWSDYLELREEAVETTTIRGVEYRGSREPFLGIIPTTGIFFLILVVILGGSFMGAEFRAGTVENLLLWEPRRTKVMATKFAAGFVSAAAIVALAMSYLVGLLVLLASVNGTFQGIDGRFWVDLIFTILRVAATGGLFFVLAMSVATITRHTAAAVVAVLGWFAVSNIVIELAAKWLRPYELFVNSIAFYGKGEPFEPVATPQGWDFLAYHHGYLAAGLIVFAWAAIPAAIATLVFVRRDLT